MKEIRNLINTSPPLTPDDGGLYEGSRKSKGGTGITEQVERSLGRENYFDIEEISHVDEMIAGFDNEPEPEPEP
ncbi:hypothetical protein KC872_01000, partial [Candidatus Kaiserbacteria bacterium]|nr:hypothetical protein [Candidatus Kaiserbacteria bacterium]